MGLEAAMIGGCGYAAGRVVRRFWPRLAVVEKSQVSRRERLRYQLTVTLAVLFGSLIFVVLDRTTVTAIIGLWGAIVGYWLNTRSEDDVRDADNRNAESEAKVARGG